MDSYESSALSSAAACLVLAVSGAPALAQDASAAPATAAQATPVQPTPVQVTPAEACCRSRELRADAGLPAQGQFENPPEAERSEEPERSDKRRFSCGVELEFRSGHADRGFVISDSPVVQPVTWLSWKAAEFSAWSNFTLAPTTDRSRPQILELELTRAHEWGNLTIAPAVRTFFYRDAVSTDRSRSIEGWLYLSYHAGPLRLFTNHSVDVLADKGAYFGEIGIALEGRVSRGVEVGGSFGGGWASSRFNDAYAGVAKSAFNRISVEGWLTAHVRPRLYIGPRFELSATVDRAVRAELAKPTWLFVGLTTGVEF